MPEAELSIGATDGIVNLACFEVGGHFYALDVSRVREIVRCQPVTPLPKSPALIEGVVDLRGRLVPVLGLGVTLGGTRVDESDPRARIAVVESDELVLGLRVDAAVDVLSVAETALEAAPQLATMAGYQALSAVVRRPDESPVLVLSLEDLVDSVQASGTAATPTAAGAEL